MRRYAKRSAGERADAAVNGGDRTYFARAAEKGHFSVCAMDLDANPVVFPLSHVAVLSDQLARLPQRAHWHAERAAAEGAWDDGVVGRGVAQIVDEGWELRSVVIERLVGGEVRVVCEVVDQSFQKKLLSESKSAIAEHEHG